MNSVDKLRDWAQELDDKAAMKTEHGFSPMGLRLGLIADEIEREVERDYMRLPVDADGVPIHVGDAMLTFGGKPVKVGAVSGGGFVVDDVPLWCGRDCLHHRAPTVEDVLREFVKKHCQIGCSSDYEDHEREGALADAINDFADKLREVLRDE